MQTITKEYLLLFNAITTATQALQQLQQQLITAQQLAEDIYLQEEAPTGEAA